MVKKSLSILAKLSRVHEIFVSFADTNAAGQDSRVSSFRNTIIRAPVAPKGRLLVKQPTEDDHPIYLKVL